MKVENLITGSHPYRPDLLTRNVLNEIYSNSWGESYGNVEFSETPVPHAEYVAKITANDAFRAGNRRPATGLVIATWNRPHYLERTLASLAASDLDDTIVVIVDDASDDQHAVALLEGFDLSVPLLKLYKNKHCNMHISLDIGWCMLMEYGCSYLVNLDADAIVHPQWLAYLKRLFASLPFDRDHILLSGFSKANGPSIIEEYDCYRVRYKMGGINYFFTPEFYRQMRVLMFNANWDSHIQYFCGYRLSKRYKMISSKPSVVQHIGKNGFNAGGPAAFDYAEDFDQDRRLDMSCLQNIS